MPVIAVVAILQPVTVLSATCVSAECDPHGYVAIFSTAPAVGVTAIAVIALVLLVRRSRAGFGTALGAAGGCAGMLAMFGEFLPVTLVWRLGAVTVAIAWLAIAGLRWAPARVRPRLVEPPYPPLG
ncbi:hypothetical protein [Kribbella sp. NPDC004875]|uniref:hypothetical protein n=1 Tax=Kribbella sp. NPDC004875 TaxID=3364107 RepID=UPI0036A2C564